MSRRIPAVFLLLFLFVFLCLPAQQRRDDLDQPSLSDPFCYGLHEQVRRDEGMLAQQAQELQEHDRELSRIEGGGGMLGLTLLVLQIVTLSRGLAKRTGSS